MEDYSQSCNTVILGISGTGKTTSAIEYAEWLASRPLPNGTREQFRPIIVLNHYNNQRSYPDSQFTALPIEALEGDFNPLLNDKHRKIRIDSNDIDLFCENLIENVYDAVIVFDDINVYFNSNLKGVRSKVIYTPKNNGNDLIFQFHSFRKVAPELADQVKVFIIKQTVEGKIRNTFNNAELLEILKEEVKKENMTRPVKQKFATRMINIEFQVVGVMDENNKYQFFDILEYFDGKI